MRFKGGGKIPMTIHVAAPAATDRAGASDTEISRAAAAVFPLLPRRGGTSRAPGARASSGASSWSSPNWRWGYANGAAHDEAMRVRDALATPARRAEFLAALEADSADFEDAKMALALKCQRSRNLRYDEPGHPWEGLMEEMAACKFEGDGGDVQLAVAIANRLNVQMSSSSPQAMVAKALMHLGFVDRGL